MADLPVNPPSPSTEAGRALLDAMRDGKDERDARWFIPRIEAEARRLTVEQIGDAITRITEETLSAPTLRELRDLLDEVAGLNASESPPPLRPDFCVSCEGQHDEGRHARDASESDR